MSDIFETGYDSSLSRSSLNLDDGSSLIGEMGKYTGALGSTVEGELEVTNLGSGAMASVLFTGKDTFASTTAGYRMGIDFSTDTYKWVIGDSANHIDWNVTTANTLTITGALSASTITGGTIQTAISGERIRIVSVNATTPAQPANSMVFINSSGDIEVFFGSSTGGSNSLLALTTYTNLLCLNIDQGAASNLNAMSINTHTSSTGGSLSITENGSGIPLYISLSDSSNTNPVLILSQTSVVETNFKWISRQGSRNFFEVNNGTSPDGNLTGSRGDICYDSTGRPWYCDANGKNWTVI
jgi:hypothetical protein